MVDARRARTTEDSQTFLCIVERSPDMVIVFDRTGHVEYLNAAAATLTGCAPGDAACRHFRELISIPPDLESEMLSAACGGNVWEGEWQWNPDGGASRWMATTVCPLPGARKRAARFAATCRDVTERHRFEQTLREKDEYFSALVAGTSDVITVVDDQGIIQYISPTIENMAGWQPEELIGASMFDFAHPDDIPALVSRFREGLGGLRNTTPATYRGKRKDGTWNILESSGGLLPGGKRYAVHTRDVTERVRQEKALRESEAKFRALAQAAPASIFINAGSKIVYANSAASEITGYSTEELMEMDFWDVAVPAARDAIRERGLARQRGEAVPNRWEVPILRKDGQVRIVDSVTARMEYEGGPTVIGMALDITARVRAEEALRQSEEKFRAVTETTPVAIFLYHEGRFLYVNETAERLTGYSRKELLAMDPWTTLHLQSVGVARERQDEGRVGGEPPVRYELKLKRKDGALRWIQYGANPATIEGRTVIMGSAVDITDRVLAEMELRESEERFRTLAELTPAAIFEVKRDGVSYVNPAGEEITGYTLDEMRSMDAWTILHPDYRDVSREIGRARARGELTTLRYELKIVRKDGHERWIDFRSRTTEAKDGLAVVGTAIDVTEQRAAEQALHESEARFRAVAEATPAAIFIVDGLQTLYVNSSSEAFFGYTREELTRIPFLDLVHPDFRDVVRTYAQARQDGRAAPSKYEAKVVVRDGSERWVECSVTPITIEGRNAVLGMALDITARRIAESLLRESEERFRQFADNLQDIVWMTDAGKRKILYLNPAYETIWGRPRESLYNDMSSFIDGVHPDDMDIALRMYNRPVQDTYEPETFRIIRPDGAVRRLRNRAFAIKDSGGQIQRIAGTVEDITDRVAAEEALRENEARLRSVIAGAPVVLWAIDSNGIVTLSEGSALPALGLNRESVIGKSVFDLYADFPDILDLHRRALAGESLTSAYTSNRLFFETRYQPQRDADGNVIGAIGVGFDVTESRLAQEALRWSEARLRAVVSTAPIALWAIDTEGILTFAEVGGLEAAGYKARMTLGQSVFEMYRDSPAVVESHRRALAGEMSTHRYASGGREYETQCVPMRGVDGKVTGAIGVATDITERVRGQEALRESEERYRHLYQDNPAMYFTVDASGSILSVNRFGAEQLGYTPEELAGRPVLDVVHEADRTVVMRSLRRCIRTPGTVVRLEFRKVRRDGSIVWVRELARAVRTDGRKPEVLLVCEDITDLKAMEETIQRTREELERKAERQIKRRNPYNLTFRELTILNLVVRGQSDKEIATVLGISTQTVNKHVSRTLKKMKALSRTEAAMRALRDGLVE